MSEFQNLFGDWTTHSVSVWKRMGSNARGDVFEEAPTVLQDLMVVEKRKTIIRSDGTSAQVEATVYCEPDELPSFNDKARVQLPSGKVGFVLSISLLDVYGLIGHGVVEVG